MRLAPPDPAKNQMQGTTVQLLKYVYTYTFDCYFGGTKVSIKDN